MPPTTDLKGPGRIGDDTLDLSTDPRTNPHLRKQLAALGLDKVSQDQDSSVAAEHTRAILAGANAGFQGLYDSIPLDVPGDDLEPKVVHTTETFKSFDGTELTLYVFRRADLATETLPAVIYSHGGGMTLINTANPVHFRWCRSLAIQGVVVIAVDFRNAFTESKPNPFPTGLNDCAAALNWVHANKGRLGISNIVLQGESGGGNLALATALKAKRDGFIDQVSGVYASIPFISGAYGWTRERKLRELPSLVECAGYVLQESLVKVLADNYSPNDLENPLAWPYHASVEDLRGLPPHIVSVDEVDPLRDEGLAYHRKLTAAGVSSRAQVNVGLAHGSAFIFRQVLLEYHNGAARDVAGFAKSL